MIIGLKLRELREERNLSQGDMEKRTGLLRCYTSRVENGHTVPSVETLEKYARALEMPMYRFFYEGNDTPKKPNLPSAKSEVVWGAKSGESHQLRQFSAAFSKMDKRGRNLLLNLANEMARRQDKKKS